MKSSFKSTGILLAVAFGIAISLLVLQRQDAPATGKSVKAAFIYDGPVDDAGWNSAQDEGRRAMAELPYVETTYRESVTDTAGVEPVLDAYIRQGFNVIFATSYDYMDATLKAAKQHPEVTFLVCSGNKTSSNVGTYFGHMYQPRYVTGIVAGRMTKSNMIGFVAAFPIPEVIRGINAFTLGVRSVNPDAKVHVIWTQTWHEPAKERAAAEQLLDMGADVVTQHQDSPEVQKAAEARGKYGIGYDTDMSSFAPKAHLTAAVWNWGIYYKRVAEQIHGGTWKPEQYWGTMADGVVGVAPYGTMVPQNVKNEAEAAKAKIMSGGWDVFHGPIRDQNGNVRVAAGNKMSDAELLTFNWFVEGVAGRIPK
jgi:basic membrane protein A